jgi:hypothetical protein
MKVAIQIERLRLYMYTVRANYPVFHFVEQANHQIMVFIQPAGLLPQGLACGKYRRVR